MFENEFECFFFLPRSARAAFRSRRSVAKVELPHTHHSTAGTGDFLKLVSSTPHRIDLLTARPRCRCNYSSPVAPLFPCVVPTTAEWQGNPSRPPGTGAREVKLADNPSVVRSGLGIPAGSAGRRLSAGRSVGRCLFENIAVARFASACRRSRW